MCCVHAASQAHMNGYGGGTAPCVPGNCPVSKLPGAVPQAAPTAMLMKRPQSAAALLPGQRELPGRGGALSIEVTRLANPAPRQASAQ